MSLLPIGAAVLLLAEVGWLVSHFTAHPPTEAAPQRFLLDTLGSLGLAFMVVMLVYSVARRSRTLRQRYRLSAWLRFHIFCGVQGVLLVFFHCWPFFFPEGARDINLLNVGLWSLVLTGIVFFSGLSGRYLFGHLSRTLQGEHMTVRDIDVEVAELEKGIPAPVAALWMDDFEGAQARLDAMDVEPTVAARATRRIFLALRRQSQQRWQRIFSTWIIAHRPLAAFMYILAAVHVVAAYLEPSAALIVVLAGLVAMAIAFVWSVVAAVAQRKAERKARDMYTQVLARGSVPPSLHPKIDLDVCVGTGACAAVCPEKDVIAVIDGKAHVVNPTNCIGHGECRAACPVDAITLVIGSATRGVDIPLIGGDFQTKVEGIYIVGELGGMGLIYNAVTQGVQALSHVKASLPAKVEGVHQLVVVGAGPAGLAASIAAIDAGLDVVTVDQEDAGGTILQYPRRKIVMTRPFELPIYGKVMLHEVSKEALLELWHDVMAKTGLQVRTRCKVEGIEKGDDGIFTVTTSQGPLRAQRVILAIGRRGSPRKLGVPGEDTSKVAYRLLEPDHYTGTRCLVVGGGDAAVEAAIALGDEGCTVHLSYRRDAFGRIKPRNQERLDASVGAGKVTLVMSSTVKEIGDDSVRISVGEAEQSLGNDYVFVFAGGVLPTKFLEASGVEVRTFRGEEFAPANA